MPKIKLADRELNIEVGLDFLGEVLEVLDCSMQDLGSKLQKNPFKYVPIMILEAAKSHYRLDSDRTEEFDLDLKTVQDLMDTDGGIMSKGAEAFLILFYEYMNRGIPKPEDDKKKELKKT